MRAALLLLAVLFGGAPVMAQVPSQIAGKRVALVIGNGAYRQVDRLPNAGSDARLIATTLQGLGFTLVGGGPLLDLDRARLSQAVQDFGHALAGADVGLFYYSGHGLQVQGVNWLVPVDANPTRPQDLDFQMVDADLVLRQMDGAGTRLNLVLLDACRNNPFANRGLRALQGGLAEMRAPQGTLISYATQPGNVAADGNGANSPYTTALARGMQMPGLDIFRMFNQVGLEVKRGTNGSQQPWVSTSPIDGDFYFAGAAAMPPVTASPTTPPVQQDSSERLLAVARGRRCSILDAQAQGGAVTLRGLALVGPDLDGLVRQIGALRGIRLAPPEIDLLPSFACPAVAVLGEAVRAARAQGGIIALARRDIAAGGMLDVILRGVAGLPIRLDVFRADGMVEHLPVGRPAPAGTGDLRVTLPLPDAASPGPRLLAVLAGGDAERRPSPERTDAYLAQLAPLPNGVRTDLAPFELRAAPARVAPPHTLPPRCAKLVERPQLGEALSEEDKAFLRSSCH
jgi:uncharacterized caspase-like protein